jgi:hypothetical protein
VIYGEYGSALAFGVDGVPDGWHRRKGVIRLLLKLTCAGLRAPCGTARGGGIFSTGRGMLGCRTTVIACVGIVTGKTDVELSLLS